MPLQTMALIRSPTVSCDSCWDCKVEWDRGDVRDVGKRPKSGWGEFGTERGEVVLRIDRERRRSFIGLDCNPCRHV